MYVSLPAPVSKPGTVAAVNPDSLAAVLTGESQRGGMSAYRKYDYGWEFRPPLRTGMGCAGGNCSCGGTCKGGMGDWLSSIGWASWVSAVLAGAGLWWVMKQDKRGGIREVPLREVRVRPLRRKKAA